VNGTIRSSVAACIVRSPINESPFCLTTGYTRQATEHQG